MAIRKRNSLPEPSAIIDYKENVFERLKNIEPKPKKSLPYPNFLGDCYSDSELRTVAAIAVSNDNPDALNVGDMVRAIRCSSNNENIEHKYRARIRGYSTAITAYCVDCQGGSRKNVTECISTYCPLWPFRLGGNPFRGKR